MGNEGQACPAQLKERLKSTESTLQEIATMEQLYESHSGA